MKLLIAPLHYYINENSGSEHTRSFEYLKQIAKDKTFSGDVLVGYSGIKQIGNFKIHNLFDEKPSHISNFKRIQFIFLVFIKSLELMKSNKYNCIWHQGPFAIDSTFSPLAIWNRKKIRFVIGPVYSPFDMRFFNNKNIKGRRRTFFEKIDALIYGLLYKIFKPLSTLTLNMSNQIITIDSAGENTIRQKGIGHVKTITLGVIKNGFSSKPKSKIGKSFDLLTVGYLLERKRVTDLIEAVAILLKKYKVNNIKLTIVGDGPMEKKVKELSQELNLLKYISFIGFVPRTLIHKFYKKADIFVSGSILDTMPGMYFEAMSAALPMVIAKNDSSVELLKNGLGGFVVKEKSPDHMAQAIYKLLKNPQIYKEFSKNNYDLINSKYDFEKNIEVLKETFK
jgi:glycosyltransferase involved in cell wall biosynthesis